ncbi:unnamed protein product [Symbiodinium sp. CCMP2592]|nr:unnamed protein product [Symbiodinium sp. CCMP2592]
MPAALCPATLNGKALKQKNNSPCGHAGQRDDVAWHTLQAAKVQSIQYATVNPHYPASRSLAARSESNSTSYHTWLPPMPRGVQHPLGFVSLQAHLVKAFCLPPKACHSSEQGFSGLPYLEFSRAIQIENDFGACIVP